MDMTSSSSRMPQQANGPDGTHLNLTLAMSEYEHARDLTSGLIRPLGINLTSLVLPIEEIFFRYLKDL